MRPRVRIRSRDNTCSQRYPFAQARDLETVCFSQELTADARMNLAKDPSCDSPSARRHHVRRGWTNDRPFLGRTPILRLLRGIKLWGRPGSVRTSPFPVDEDIHRSETVRRYRRPTHLRRQHHLYRHRCVPACSDSLANSDSLPSDVVGRSCIEGRHRRFVESNLARCGVLLQMLNAARSRDQHRVWRMRVLPCQADLRCRHSETESDDLDTVLVDDLGECAKPPPRGSTESTRCRS